MKYLGHTMYAQWQETLLQEELEHKEHEQRQQKRKEQKERKLLELKREFQLKQENEAKQREGRSDRPQEEVDEEEMGKSEDPGSPVVASSPIADKSKSKKGFFNLLSLKRSTSMEKLAEQGRLATTMHEPHRSRIIRPIFRSPSMPAVNDLAHADPHHIAIDIREAVDDSENESLAASEDGIIV